MKNFDEDARFRGSVEQSTADDWSTYFRWAAATTLYTLSVDSGGGNTTLIEISDTGDMNVTGGAIFGGGMSITGNLSFANIIAGNIPAARITSGTLDVARSWAHSGGDVTSPAGSAVLTIVAGAVGNTKLVDMANFTIKGRHTAATGDPEDLTPAQVREVIGQLGRYKTADESLSSTTTLQADDHLGVTLPIGVYDIECVIRATTGGQGMKVTLVGSGGFVAAAGSEYVVEIREQSTGAVVANGALSTFDGSTNVGAAGGASVYIVITGQIDVTTAGVITPHWAPFASAKANTTWKKYSNIRYRPCQ